MRSRHFALSTFALVALFVGVIGGAIRAQDC